MPKGRIGISGPEPFYRVRLPKNNEEAHTNEQRSLLSLVAIKDQVLLELDERRSTDSEPVDVEELWDAIIDAVGGYLGQAKQGLPPTTAQRDKALLRIQKAALKLEEEITAADFHVTDMLHKAMRRRGSGLYELKKHVETITDYTPVTEGVRELKARPDPYLEYLIRELVQIWMTATNSFPGKTGTNHYEGGRTSPFYRWCNMIAEPVIDKKLPRDLIDSVIKFCRPDG